MTMVEVIPVKAHKWEREKDEHYVENFWCSEALVVRALHIGLERQRRLKETG